MAACNSARLAPGATEHEEWKTARERSYARVISVVAEEIQEQIAEQKRS